MVYPLLSPALKTANRDFLTGFETSKELDPDFLAFNSENRRYHFPGRFYFPSRADFAQVDPLNFHRSELPRIWFPYVYVANRPNILVDPWGLEIYKSGGEAGKLSDQGSASDECNCGTAQIKYQVDASSTRDAFQDIPGTGPPAPPTRYGLWVLFGWIPRDKPLDSTKCEVCCTGVSWAHWRWKNGEWIKDGPSMPGRTFGYNAPKKLYWMADYPGRPDAESFHTHFRGIAVCNADGKIMYWVDYFVDISIPPWYVYNWIFELEKLHVSFGMIGRCGEGEPQADGSSQRNPPIYVPDVHPGGIGTQTHHGKGFREP